VNHNVRRATIVVTSETISAGSSDIDNLSA
jgi:hypothetical protein